MEQGRAVVIDREGLQALLDALAARGFDVVGPRRRDGAIVYDRISLVADLPEGWTDRQEAGRYRLERRDDAALFGYAVGPQGWKRWLHPPEERLWSAVRTADGFAISEEAPAAAALAFVGVRGCELHAIAIQDRVLLGGPHEDPRYAARRRGAFIVAVNCGVAGGTCFCVSMGTGPRVDAGFDLSLTEIIDGPHHEFLVEIGSERGAEVMAGNLARPADDAARAAGAAISARTAASMGRTLETAGLKERLQAGQEDAHWDEVAARCLSCANCTLVCPTCFCTSVADHTDLSGAQAERVRRWDSCFTADFSYLHGGSVRPSTRGRYRQWLTHKLAHWHDQFGSSGCVGCGRCITWCPVGIDITREAAAIGGKGSDGNA